MKWCEIKQLMKQIYERLEDSKEKEAMMVVMELVEEEIDFEEYENREEKDYANYEGAVFNGEYY